jgi:hypothetical protein
MGIYSEYNRIKNNEPETRSIMLSWMKTEASRVLQTCYMTTKMDGATIVEVGVLCGGSYVSNR